MKAAPQTEQHAHLNHKNCGSSRSVSIARKGHVPFKLSVKRPALGLASEANSDSPCCYYPSKCTDTMTSKARSRWACTENQEQTLKPQTMNDNNSVCKASVQCKIPAGLTESKLSRSVTSLQPSTKLKLSACRLCVNSGLLPKHT